MQSTELIQHAKRIQALFQHAGRVEFKGAHAQACEFLRNYAGPKSSFLESMLEMRGYANEYGAAVAANILQSFIDYVKSGLQGEISPERRAQLDTVSDFLGQANQLLETKEVHPAAPAVLVGAALEEFLRTWAEAQGLSIGDRRPSLDAYATVLREADLITKQDAKDITAWAGIRNHAAHGEWEEVNDKKRVLLMLEGVNLFMRKYGG